MALQFVLGSSGSGKTQDLYAHIVEEAGRNPKKNYLVLVPEQFTMQTQQKLVSLAPNQAIMNIDVLSFKRLAYRVFDELGLQTLQILEETGKNLVLRRLAQAEEENLTVFRPNMNRMGYIGEVKSLISEFVQYNITPEQLMSLTTQSELPELLRAKLKDVVTMYRAFEQFMKERYVTSEEILTILRRHVRKSEILRDCVIVFDEFTGFTPIQKDLLRELLPVAEQVMVTLTIDEREISRPVFGKEDLFYLSKHTMEVLTEMATGLGVEVLDPVIKKDSMKKRFQNSPDLAFLEHEMFRIWQTRYEEEPENIHLDLVGQPKEELILAARRISELVRAGARYQDIAIVTGAVENYEGYVDEVFGKYEIPYFLDTTRSVLFHPFIEFLRTVLEVIDSNFSYHSVMRMLRCGYFDLEEELVDRLDNYLLATGIRGKAAWRGRWLRMPRNQGFYDLTVLNSAREQIIQVLEPLLQVFEQPKSCVRDAIMGLYQILAALEVERKLWERHTLLLEEGEQAKAKEYEQIYALVMDLFDKYHLLLAEEPLHIDDFTEVLEAGLSALEVAVIPPGYDTVTIGDIERTRLNHIKIIFFIGVNDGIIPKSIRSGGIISEYEREQLADFDLEMAPGSRELAFIQRFYLYRSLTKPSEELYISYAKMDREGKAVRPSYLIAAVRRLFPKLVQTEHETLLAEPVYFTRDSALDYLIHGSQETEWYALAGWFAGDDRRREQFRALLDARYFSYHEEPISRAVASALYGRTVETSVTRLERFASCAYAHFLQYGLRLQEREQCGFESVDMGNIYHTALERYSRTLAESEYDWHHVPEEVRRQMAETAMDEAIAGYPNAGVFESQASAFQLKKMHDIFDQTVWALTEQVRAGSFQPKEFEVSFRELDDIKTLQIDLEQDARIQLAGRIDRVDVQPDGEGRVAVKVIDYKSGSTKFDLVKLYYGRQLQLAMYLNVALELGEHQNAEKTLEIVPGGILYYHIDDPELEVTQVLDETAVKRSLLEKLRPEGLISREEWIYRAMDDKFEGKSAVIPMELKKDGSISEARSSVASTEEFELIRTFVDLEVRSQAEEIFRGTVAVRPFRSKNESGCDYCPYHGVCGFDRRIAGYEYRDEETVGKDEVMDKIQTRVAMEKAKRGKN